MNGQSLSASILFFHNGRSRQPKGVKSVSMKENKKLKTYWIIFPENLELPFGVGVAAMSVDDMFFLIEREGIDWHKHASKTEIKEDISIADLDQSNIVPNIGPMQFRGVWYPCQNIGYGAPKYNEYKPINE